MPLSTPIEPYSYYRRGGGVDEPIYEPLSGYLAGKERGGKCVQRLEDAWAERFGVKHAIACNSATSGLYAAGVVCGPSFPDQTIAVPCFTMSATAAAPMLANPDNDLYFMDCDPETYCSTPLHCPFPSKVSTIVVTDLFGQAANLTGWRQFANMTGALLIEDAAQAPFAETDDGQLAGTVGDVGVFSLNVHKHLQVGEGGIIVTNDDDFAHQMRGIINHGECLSLTPGLNLRMTEITAAMAYKQLRRAEYIIASRIALAHELSDMVRDFWAPPIENGKHVFYHWAVRVPNRDEVCDFLRSEGIPVRNGYVKPLYHLPALAFPKPCAMAEKAHKELMIFEICSWDPNTEQLKEMKEIFKRASDFSNMEKCAM